MYFMDCSVRNACHKRRLCRFEQHLYSAETAYTEYRDGLVNSRSGFDLTCGQLDRIDRIVSPLIKKGQSVYHIVQTNKNELAVSRRPRKRRKTHPDPPVLKTGHLYCDYLEYIKKNDVSVVQMDCVEGKAEDHCALLTLHFSLPHMQLAFLIEEHTSSHVVAVLDAIEKRLGKALFALCFPVILTDNGHEFWDIEGMEKSVYGVRRTKIFFCEPNRFDQKGQCENNHKLIRDVIPKGTSLDRFTQEDILLMMNHINSYKRKSLFGCCPYEVARKMMPQDFFDLLGLKRIRGNQVMLSPALLKPCNTSK